MFFFVFCRYKQQNFMYLAQLLVQAEATIACFVRTHPNRRTTAVAPPARTISTHGPLIYIYVSQDYLRTDDPPLL